MIGLLSKYYITPTDGLVLRNDVHGYPLTEPTMLSLLDIHRYEIAGYTAFESLCIRAIEGAMNEAVKAVLSSPRTQLIVSSTKGDIWTPLPESASRIAAYLGMTSRPVVVSNACTSGVCAQLTAYRMLKTGLCDTAIVVGCDVLNDFIISGFRSFKSLCPERCRPFDDTIQGLNLGEAAACMILGRDVENGWSLLGGGIHNDANHISGPSRTAEGAYRCLQDALRLLPHDEVGAVSVHGTGTLYNDTMELLALQRAGLTDIPMLHYKAVYGHTLGAAGVLETLLTMEAPMAKNAFIKMLSGFGGVNAAVAWRNL